MSNPFSFSRSLTTGFVTGQLGMETQHRRAKWPYGVIHLYVHIYIHIILHIVKYIQSLECNKLCTNHFGTSHAVSLLQSFIALRLFFTSLADKIASELQRWSCSEAEQGRIYIYGSIWEGTIIYIYIYSIYIYIYMYICVKKLYETKI